MDNEEVFLAEVVGEGWLEVFTFGSDPTVLEFMYISKRQPLTLVTAKNVTSPFNVGSVSMLELAA